jgi:hypothetical protein
MPAKPIEPLQTRETALLAQERKARKSETGNPGKRAAYRVLSHFLFEKALYKAV